MRNFQTSLKAIKPWIQEVQWTSSTKNEENYAET